VLADIHLARRLEAAEAVNAASCARSGGAVIYVAGGCAVFAGDRSPLSQAVGLGLNGPVPEPDVDRIEEFFRSRGAPVSVDFCPLADPGLLEILGRRGYRAAEFTTVLVRELAGFEPAHTDSRVRPAAAAEADLWVRTVGSGFCERDELSADERNVGRLILSIPAACYFGFALSGDPAAAAAMTVHSGLAVLFGDSTRVAFRRQGLHAALIAARLADAHTSGCDLATAATAPGSPAQAHFEHAGFRVAYTKVSICE
jgi:hypothetical protein